MSEEKRYRKLLDWLAYNYNGVYRNWIEEVKAREFIERGRNWSKKK